MIDDIAHDLPLEKRCIFCGRSPGSKNKEHVIPRWLISLTGDPKRIWHLGVRYDVAGKPNRQFSADQFQFPACEECNSSYSDLEGRSSTSVQKLLGNESLTAREWDDLMDWFDKVRVGLFLGNMMLNKSLPNPSPKFHISQRIGIKDRCTLVYPLDPETKGLRICGGGDPVFFHMPTSFILSINHLLFMNLSSDFLLAPRMGFPYPGEIETIGVRTRVDGFRATFRPKVPFVRFGFYPAILGVYQTILMADQLRDEVHCELIESEYVRSKLLTDSKTKTLPCVIEGGRARFLQSSDIVAQSELRASYRKTYDEYGLRFFRYRHSELDRCLSIEQKSSSPLIRQMMKFNGYAIDQVKSGTHMLERPN